MDFQLFLLHTKYQKKKKKNGLLHSMQNLKNFYKVLATSSIKPVQKIIYIGKESCFWSLFKKKV